MWAIDILEEFWRLLMEAACGRTVVDSPVKMKEGDSDVFFCCEHCADAYVRGNRAQSGSKERRE